jgi:hypothetical protein
MKTTCASDDLCAELNSQAPDHPIFQDAGRAQLARREDRLLSTTETP